MAHTQVTTCSMLTPTDINIQSVTHDSTEDARTALRLYKKYQELSAEGGDKIRRLLKDMYDKGRKLGWKIPELEVDRPPPGSDSPRRMGSEWSQH